VINSSLCAAPSGTHTVLNRSLSCLFVVAHACVVWCCLGQCGSRLRQLRRSLANPGAPLSAVGSQRPYALAADCAPEVSPSLSSPPAREIAHLAREIAQHRKVETLGLGTEVVITSNLCATERNNLSLHTKAVINSSLGAVPNGRR